MLWIWLKWKNYLKLFAFDGDPRTKQQKKNKHRRSVRLQSFTIFSQLNRMRCGVCDFFSHIFGCDCRRVACARITDLMLRCARADRPVVCIVTFMCVNVLVDKSITGKHKNRRENIATNAPIYLNRSHTADKKINK